MDLVPPTVTAQMRRVMFRHGKPMFYDSPRLKAARNLFVLALSLHRPEIPLTGPLSLTVEWHFLTRSHREGTWRDTRPDTDNLQKLLKDCMTQVGFWKDDAQVCREEVSKKWTREKPGLLMRVVSLDA